MYLGFQGLCALVRPLPLRLARALGRTAGRLAYALLRGQRRLVLAHLELAFGSTVTRAQRTRIARGVFSNLGQNAMEWMVLPRLSSRALQQLIASAGVEHLRHVLQQGRGAIMVTAHFGDWELISPYLRTLGFEGGVVARRLRYPEYERFLHSLRGARGIQTLTRGSLKEVATLLRANQLVGMLPDQDIDSLEGVFVNFFGRPAHTPVGPAALSLMTGAPIVPCFMIRQGPTFQLVIDPPIPMPQTSDRAAALTQLTQAWSGIVERYIRQYPDQWVWMHRRWKTQPAHCTLHTAHRDVNAGMSMHHGPQPVLCIVPFAVCCLLSAALSGCGKSAPPTSTRTAAIPAATPAAPPTEHMSEFSLVGYAPDGTKRWELEGQGATLDGTIVTIHHPNGIGHDPVRQAYLTASAAQVNQTNRHVRLEHDVTIHTSDGLWFTTPILHWIPDQDQMATDQPVRLETDHMLIRGYGANGLTQLKQAQILRDVEMVLNPTDHDLPTTGPSQVTITCDGPLSFDYSNNIATFEQNVHVKDPNGDLYSDTLIAYLDEKTRTIRYAEAIGHVRIHQEQNTALSERAIYEPAIGKMTLVGKPSLLVYPSQQQDTQLSFGGLASEKRPTR